MSLMTPVMPGVWRWATPDPEDDWMMVAHLLETGSGVVLVDPPLVPGLAAAMDVLGGVAAIVLTTADHTRGARWLSPRFDCPVHVPAQGDRKRLQGGGVTRPVFYEDGEMLPGGLTAVRCRVPEPVWTSDGSYIDEMMLVTAAGAVLTGDVVLGTEAGGLLAAPEGFTDDPKPETARQSLDAFRTALPSGAHTLLASHGADLVGTLELALAQRTAG